MYTVLYHCDSSEEYVIVYLQCILSSIIVVALRSMFLQLLQLKKLLHISAYDFVSINNKSFIPFVFGLVIDWMLTKQIR